MSCSPAHHARNVDEHNLYGLVTITIEDENEGSEEVTVSSEERTVVHEAQMVIHSDVEGSSPRGLYRRAVLAHLGTRRVDVNVPIIAIHTKLHDVAAERCVNAIEALVR